MKKLICFIIIAVFSGFVFFTGWTQLKIKPETIGIVQSKIKGINEKPVVPGKYCWNWEFLIPGNASLKVFETKPFNTSKTISGAVANGDAFTGSDLLSYRFTYSLTVSYTPESVVNLIKNNYISNQEDFETYLSNAADYICQSATNYYLSKLTFDSSFKPEYIKRDELIKNINSYKEFPELDIVIISLTDYKLPNYPLYNKLQNQSITNVSELNKNTNTTSTAAAVSE